MGTLSTSKPNAWLEKRLVRGESTTLIHELFARLSAMYSNRWASAFPSQASIDAWSETWADALAEEGITPHMAAEGVRTCRRRHDWPPSLPEFLKACRPPIDYEAAFEEAVVQMRARDTGDDKWTHPAIYWAALDFGPWELRQASWATAKTKWARILDRFLADQNLPPVPARLVALPSPGKTHPDQEKVRSMIEQLRQKLVVPMREQA